MKKNCFLMNGVEVEFPFENPYPSQKAIMAGAISAFKSFSNALLESPTGTGKSLALLAAAMGYQVHIGNHPITAPERRDPFKHHNEELVVGANDCKFAPALELGQRLIIDNPPDDMIKCNVVVKRHNVPVWYTSRTHQQLKQLVGELKKLKSYHPQMAILASRKRICLNKSVATANSADAACGEVLRKKKCQYSLAKNIPNEFLPYGRLEKFDLEDLMNYCKQKMICPYSLARVMMKKADLVFCPYNYILNPKVKGQMMLSILGVILIIDEAHNIENTIRECISFNHPRSELIFDIVYSMKLIEKHKNSEFSTHLEVLRNLLSGYLQYLTKKAYYMRENGIVEYIESDCMEFFNALGVTKLTWPKIRLALDYVFVVVNGSIVQDTKEVEKVSMVFADTLEQLYCVLGVCFKLNLKFINSFKFVIKLGDIEENDRVLALCMDPGCYFSTIADEVNTVILSSGTLTPINQLPNEFGTPFSIRVSTTHVITPSQVLSFTIPESSDGIQFLSTHAYLSENSYKVQLLLGKTILEFLPLIPGGVLFFLPSHKFLKSMMNVWIKEKIIDKIQEIKPLFFESKDYSEKLYDDYKEAIERDGGALLIGVCRGKMSEGIDFYDNQCRCVIIFGIPYPPFQELEIRLKRQYNDEKAEMEDPENRGMNGDEWYDSQAYRALFQAIGRCIRHKDDYGSVILLDSRFEKNIEKFPRWIKNNIHTNTPISIIKNKLIQFYKEMSVRFKPKITFQKSMSSIFACTSCGNHILKTESLDYTLSRVKRKGMLELLKQDSKSLTLFMSKKYLNNMNTQSIKIEDIEWSQLDNSGYQIIKCNCGLPIGCILSVGGIKDIPMIDGAWILPENITVIQNQFSDKLLNVLPIEQTYTLVPQGKGQQILCQIEI